MNRCYFKVGLLDGPELPLWRSLHRFGISVGWELVISLLTPSRNPPEELHLLPDARTLGAELTRDPSLPKVPEDVMEACLKANRFWGTNFHTPERVHALFAGYAAQIGVLGPEVILIWNCHQVAGRLLRCLADTFGIPYMVVERSAWPLLLTLDESDSLLNTRAYRELVDQQTIGLPQTTDCAEMYVREIVNSVTWWEQPDRQEGETVRERFGLSRDTKILLFAIQVDSDVQNLLYNPDFQGSEGALRALRQALEHRDDVFILAKHHPKSPVSAEVYDKVLEGKGRCLSDLSLEDALSEADYVAGVNSALLFEASLRKKPVLAMGQTMLTGCAVFHEWSKADPRQTVDDWIADGPADTEHRYTQHLRCLEYLLNEHLIYCGDRDDLQDLLRAPALLRRLEAELEPPGDSDQDGEAATSRQWRWTSQVLERASVSSSPPARPRFRHRLRKKARCLIRKFRP